MRAVCIALAAGVCLAAPASASADPKILRAGLEQSALTGLGLTFAVEAADPQQGITSLAVRFADGGAFGESTCRLDRKGNPKPVRGFGAGRRARLAFPFAPTEIGEQTLDVTVTSGACGLTPRRVRESVKIRVGLADLPALPVPKTGPKAGTSQAEPCAGMNLVPAASNRRKIRSAILCLLNLQRGARHLPLLRARRGLRVAARRHSSDMLRRHYFDHQGPNGPTLADRLRRVGYWPASAAENLGLGSGTFATPLNVVLAWLDSDSHRENMLERKYTDLGVGVVVSGGNAAYTADLGSR